MSPPNTETTGAPAPTPTPARLTGTPSSATASAPSPEPEGRAVALPPTQAEPIPALVGTRGLALLRSAVAKSLVTSLKTDDLVEAAHVAELILASLIVAKVAEVSDAYEGLALHFPHRKRKPNEDDMVIANWLTDLADMPADLLTEACRLYRIGGSDRFPTCGQLRATVQPMLTHRQVLAKRARALLDLLPRPSA